MQALVLNEFGEPEKMHLGEAPEAAPGEGQVLVKVRAAGVNRADTLQRKGLYPPPPGESEIMGLELVIRNVSAKWRMPQRGWKMVLNQFAILFEDRLQMAT